VTGRSGIAQNPAQRSAAVIVVFNADRCSGSRAKTTGKTCSFGDIGRLALLTKETALLSRRQFRCCDAFNKKMSDVPAFAQFGAMQQKSLCSISLTLGIPCFPNESPSRDRRA
jgi:hypothetical protein